MPARLPSVLLASLLVCACATLDRPEPVSDIRVTDHRDGDDLLAAGLDLAALRAEPRPPAGATPPALRRLAIHNNWRGLINLAPGAFEDWYGDLPSVPGREVQALLKLPDTSQPHRVLLQIPDRFDPADACLVVTASSGSRGIYGGVPVAGLWGLPKGCAVVHTDKGTGTDYYDLDTGTGVTLDGTRGRTGLAFSPEVPADPARPHRVAVKHAHSGDNPEAHWGEHVIQAMHFALARLPELTSLDDADAVRVIAMGLSNGGGAVLQAAELDGAGRIEFVAAGAPQVLPPGGRALYDYATEAALYQPCALLHERLHQTAFAGMALAGAPARCQRLSEAGLVDGGTPQEQAASAFRSLQRSGWSEGALEMTGMNAAFGLWRSIGVTYASSYLGAGPLDMPAGYGFAVTDEAGRPRASTPAERNLWWSLGSGIPPGAGIMILDAGADDSEDPEFPGLVRLRALWNGGNTASETLHAAVEAVRVDAEPKVDRVVIVHGNDDGLVPVAFSSGPYAEAAGEDIVRLVRVTKAQHFDAFLAHPFMAGYKPLLPEFFDEVDRAWSELDEE